MPCCLPGPAPERSWGAFPEDQQRNWSSADSRLKCPHRPATAQAASCAAHRHGRGRVPWLCVQGPKPGRKGKEGPLSRGASPLGTLASRPSHLQLLHDVLPRHLASTLPQR